MGIFRVRGAAQIDSTLNLPSVTSSRALIINGSNQVAASATTSAELAFLSGVTSSVQTQLNDIATDVADLVTLSGVAANSVDLGTFTGTIIPDNSDNKEALQALETAIDTLPDPMEYKGLWNASTNSPALTDGTGNNGDVWQVSVAGTQFTPSISFDVGDKAVYNGATAKYEKWDMTDAVISVNGQNGIVVLDSDDIAEGATNLYFTDERAQDAVGAMVDDSAKVSLTYSDATPSLTADIIADSLVNADINSAAAIARTKLASGTANHVLINDGSGVMSSEALLNVSRGGTGVDGSAVTNGQLLIGHDANNNFSLATLTAGSGVSITNGAGSITIAATGNANDIPDTNFAGAESASNATITGFAFANANVRSFDALVSVSIDATADLNEVFTIRGVQRGADWDLTQTSNGDDCLVTFSISAAGQMRYSSTTYAGFVSMDIQFRAITLAT